MSSVKPTLIVKLLTVKKMRNEFFTKLLIFELDFILLNFCSACCKFVKRSTTGCKKVGILYQIEMPLKKIKNF